MNTSPALPGATCPACGQGIESDRAFCPHCGARTGRRSAVYTLLIGVLARILHVAAYRHRALSLTLLAIVVGAGVYLWSSQRAADPWVQCLGMVDDTARTAEALQMCTRAAAANPGLATAHTALAVLYRRQGDEARALIETERALAIDPAEPLALNMRCYMLNGGDSPRYDEGVAVCARAAEVDPDGASVHLNNQAWALARLGRCAEALPIAEQSLGLEPSQHATLNTKAYIQVCLSRYGDALQTIAAIVPQQDLDAWDHMVRAAARVGLNQFDLALADIATATSIDPAETRREVAANGWFAPLRATPARAALLDRALATPPRAKA